jgi:phosphatidate cytidylyltransferase
LFAAIGPAFALLLLALLVASSIVGDLFESLLKRQAGVKDSGQLLPGHGGVLDRLDAMVPVLPSAAVIQWLVR